MALQDQNYDLWYVRLECEATPHAHAHSMSATERRLTVQPMI